MTLKPRVSLLTNVETNTGTVRASTSIPMNSRSDSGSSNTPPRLMPAPDTMKNTGMKKPKPTTSSFFSSAWSPSGMMKRRTKPAVKPPSTASRSKAAHRATRASRMTTTRRTRVWALVSRRFSMAV